MFKLYRPIELGEQIVVGADTGESISYCAAVCISKKQADTPLTYHARIESSQFGIELYKMGQYIKVKTGEFPLLAVERNLGMATIAKLRDLQYPEDRLYKQKSYDHLLRLEQERIGWVTSSANRRKMLDDLAMAVRKREVHILSEEILKEMRTFILPERENEPRAERGTFSDLIFACAIAHQMYLISGGKGQWVAHKKQPDDRFVPERAEGFIVEHFSDLQKKDWRGV